MSLAIQIYTGLAIRRICFGTTPTTPQTVEFTISIVALVALEVCQIQQAPTAEGVIRQLTEADTAQHLSATSAQLSTGTGLTLVVVSRLMPTATSLRSRP